MRRADKPWTKLTIKDKVRAGWLLASQMKGFKEQSCYRKLQLGVL
jgi:hypothetical protein